MMKHAILEAKTSGKSPERAEVPSLQSRPQSFNQLGKADCEAQANRLKQKQLNLSAQTQSITNYQAIIRVLSQAPPADSPASTHAPISGLLLNPVECPKPASGALLNQSPAQDKPSAPRSSQQDHPGPQAPIRGQSDLKSDQTRNQEQVFNQSRRGELVDQFCDGDQSSQQFDKCEHEQAQKTNPFLPDQNIAQVPKSERTAPLNFGEGAQGGEPSQASCEKPTTNGQISVASAPNVPSEPKKDLGNGGAACLNLKPDAAADQSARLRCSLAESNQNNLLCGTKRLYNQTELEGELNEVTPQCESPLASGYLKSPFKSRDRQALQATSVTKKQAAFLQKVPQVQMISKACLEPLTVGTRFELADQSQNFVLVCFKTAVAGRVLQDSFLWPKEEQNLLQMKFFAANLLADAFGRQFGALDPREVEFFTCNLAYVILRELDLVRHPNLSLRQLAQDGILDSDPFESKAGPVAENLLKIDIDVRLSQDIHLCDSFEWDLTNPDNSPEEFAALLVSDFTTTETLVKSEVSLAEIEWLEKAVALEIRRKIDLQVLSQARRFKKTLATLASATEQQPVGIAGKAEIAAHFTGRGLGAQLGAERLPVGAPLRSEDEIPGFLRLQKSEKATELRQQATEGDAEDTLASSCQLYSEMALKNAKFKPLYPLRATTNLVNGQQASRVQQKVVVVEPFQPVEQYQQQQIPPQLSAQDDYDEQDDHSDDDQDDEQAEKEAQAINIAFLQPRSVNFGESDAIAVQDQITSMQTSPRKPDSSEQAPLRDSNEERGDEEAEEMKDVEIFLQQEQASMATRSSKRPRPAAPAALAPNGIYHQPVAIGKEPSPQEEGSTKQSLSNGLTNGAAVAGEHGRASVQLKQNGTMIIKKAQSGATIADTAEDDFHSGSGGGGGPQPIAYRF